MPDNTLRALAEICGQLSAETRLKIILELDSAGELSVNALAERAGITPGAASQHLHKMRAADLVDFRKVAQPIYYSLAEPRHPLVVAVLAMLKGNP